MNLAGIAYTLNDMFHQEPQLINKERLQKCLDKGLITQEQYDSIISSEQTQTMACD